MCAVTRSVCTMLHPTPDLIGLMWTHVTIWHWLCAFSTGRRGDPTQKCGSHPLAFVLHQSQSRIRSQPLRYFKSENLIWLNCEADVVQGKVSGFRGCTAS